LPSFHPQRRATYLNRTARLSLGFPNRREKSEGSFMASQRCCQRRPISAA